MEFILLSKLLFVFEFLILFAVVTAIAYMFESVRERIADAFFFIWDCVGRAIEAVISLPATVKSWF